MVEIVITVVEVNVVVMMNVIATCVLRVLNVENHVVIVIVMNVVRVIYVVKL
jgi:hypothetical protein